MTKEYKKKAKQLGKNMNAKSKFAIPLVECILECFEIVFTEQEIDYMLLMEEGCYTKAELKKLWNLDDDNFEKEFSSIRDKGGIWQSKGEGVYDVTPIFPGWIELFASGPVTEQRKALLSKFGEFEDVLKSLNIAPVRTYMNHVNTKNMQTEEGRMSTIVARGTKKRVIGLNKKVDAAQTVFTGNEIFEIIKRHKDELAVMNCFCRVKKMLEGHDCDYDMPMEACLSVGRMAVQLENAGVARHVTYDEAVKLIGKLEDKGCIHTLYHYGTYSPNEEIIICNCCIDCCFLYSSYREGALSQLLMKAYYKPEIINEDKCVGCNKCSKYCPTDATWFDKKENKLKYIYDKCIGCGQCVTQCPFEVRYMEKDERNVFVKTEKRNWGGAR